jgi:ribose-phosphate pyrophosphokinase
MYKRFKKRMDNEGNTETELTLAMMHKEREGGAGNVSSMTIVGQVKDQECLMVDDMADTCGTMCAAAEELVKAGAKRVVAAVTHAVFSRDAITKINACDAIEAIYVTDTCVSSPENLGPKFHVMSVAEVFAEAIHRNYTHQSVSDLFH